MKNDLSKQSAIITAPEPLDFESFAAGICKIYDRKADSLYVIMDAKHTTCVKDPGLGRPWCSPNIKLAESVAATITRETKRKTHVVTLSDAIKFLLRQLSSRN